MSRKPDGTERSGRGTAPSAAGGFGGADTALSRLARPFVPKPFRSLGGMSASADTMLSIGMGRHNNDDELPEDQVNIAGIVDRKVSDRRYLPRKLKSMQYYLNTMPVSELLELDGDEINEAFESYEMCLTDLDFLVTEARRKKKKKTDEMSTTGGVAGYTGPLTGPRSPKQFYDTMARVAGGEYLIDPAKNLKAKP